MSSNIKEIARLLKGTLPFSIVGGSTSNEFATLISHENASDVDPNRGIGRTQLVGSVPGDYILTLQNNTTTPYTMIIKDASGSDAGYPLFNVTDSTASSTYLRVDSNTGRVGIGTQTMNQQLNVEGSIYISKPNNGGSNYLYIAASLSNTANNDSPAIQLQPNDYDPTESSAERNRTLISRSFVGHTTQPNEFRIVHEVTGDAKANFMIDGDGEYYMYNSVAAVPSKLYVGDYQSRFVLLQSPSSLTDNGRVGTATDHHFEINAGNGGGTNNMYFLTDNTEKMRITNAGNVGINQNNPTIKLEVVDTNNEILLLKQTDGPASYMTIGPNNNTGAKIGYDNTDSADLATIGHHNVGNVININNAGNVGIGTESPSSLAHVYNGTLQIGSKTGDTSLQDNPIAIRIAAIPNESTEWGGIQWYREFSDFIGAAITAARPDTSESKTELIFKTTDSAADATEKMRITSAGNVGIGTDSIDARLHVNQSIESTGVGSSSNPIAIIQNVRFNTGSSSSVLRFDTNEISGTDQYPRAAIGAEYDDDSNLNGRLLFATADNSGVIQERMRITGDGKVGIGYNNPTTATLEIYGGADDSEIIRGRTDGGNGNNARFSIKAYSDGGGPGYGGGIKIQTRDTVNIFHDALTIDSAGVMIIGSDHQTATPNNATVIAPYGAGTDIAGGFLSLYGGRSTGTAVGGDIILYTSPAGGSTGTSVNAHLEIMRITSAGHALITNNTATAYANVAPNISNFGLVIANNQNHVSGGIFSGLQFNNTGDSQNRITYIGAITEDVNQNSSLVFGTDSGGSGRTEKMRITSDGNVLIGDTSLPAAPTPSNDGVFLYATGSIKVINNINNGGSSFYGLASSTNVNAAAAAGHSLNLFNLDSTDGNLGGSIRFGKADSLSTSYVAGVNISHTNRDGALAFGTSNGSSPVERMRITKDGNVGINFNLAPFTTNTGTYPTPESAIISPLMAAIDFAGTADMLSLANTNNDGTADGVAINFGLNRNENDVIRYTPAISFVKENQWTGTPTTVKAGLRFSVQNQESVVEAMRIDSGGDVSITSGNLILSNGAGIDFSATPNTGNMTSELLDDYEEGVFTASFSTDTGSITLNTSYDTLSYTKIGNQVTIRGRVRLASVSSPTGTLNMSLPFQSVATVEEDGMACGDVYIVDAARNSGDYGCVVFEGVSVLTIYHMTGTTYGAMAADLSGDESIVITITYQAA